MGGCIAKTEKKKEDDKGGIVKHRGAAENRVSESELQLAELKSRINKIKQHEKKIRV